MALLFMDGFDHYATADIYKKWNSQSGGGTTIYPTGGRRGGGYTGSNYGYGMNKSISTSSLTLVTGYATKFTVTIGGRIDLWGNNGHGMGFMRYNTDGSVSVYGGYAGTYNWGSHLGSTAPGIFTIGSWYYIEWKVFINASTGYEILRVNNTEVLNLTGLNTYGAGMTATTVTSWTLGLGSNQYDCYADDLYILDDTGTTCNDFLGDVRIDCHYPTAEGATHAWTPSTGANNAALIDETAPNTTDYNSTNTLNAVDTFVIEDLKNPGANVIAVQTNICHSKEDAGPCLMAPVARPVSTDIAGNNFAPSESSYVYQRTIYETNPGNNALWTESDFNATEFGYKKTE